ncbi:aromatase/cyclase [Micromonospora sp. LOL_023]|uniref:aromatase/cyclase n=1 Tax=Micromonospora sp. LOL_023 TaxID=3345418 RepID=UPI003A8756F5
MAGITEVSHEVAVDAPVDIVYRLIVEAANWPLIFPPTVHVERDDLGGGEERIRIWATANGEAKTWISRRRLDAEAWRVDFRQEVSQPPVGAMGGSWLVRPLGDRRCQVVLLHDYRAVDDDPGKLAWIAQAVDRNSDAELTALKTAAERADGRDEFLLTFDDTVRIEASAKDVYDFLNEAQRWSERLPHVSRVKLQEDVEGLQVLEMDTRTGDGSTHTTMSVRVCLPYERIVYKQIVLPALMTLHTGHWLIEETDGGVQVTSRHTVRINEANVARILGPEAGVAEAKAFVRQALSTNSLATLGHAKEHSRR